MKTRSPQVCILGSAEPGTPAYDLASAAGQLLANHGITVVSGCGSPATRVAAESALAAGGVVVSIVPTDDIALRDWPCSVLIPCGMGGARNLLIWLHRRPLLPLTGCGGWSDRLQQEPPDERQNSPILPWGSVDEWRRQLAGLGWIQS